MSTDHWDYLKAQFVPLFLGGMYLLSWALVIHISHHDSVNTVMVSWATKLSDGIGGAFLLSLKDVRPWGGKREDDPQRGADVSVKTKKTTETVVETEKDKEPEAPVKP